MSDDETQQINNHFTHKGQNQSSLHQSQNFITTEEIIMRNLKQKKQPYKKCMKSKCAMFAVIMLVINILLILMIYNNNLNKAVKIADLKTVEPTSKDYKKQQQQSNKKVQELTGKIKMLTDQLEQHGRMDQANASKNKNDKVQIQKLKANQQKHNEKDILKYIANQQKHTNMHTGQNGLIQYSRMKDGKTVEQFLYDPILANQRKQFHKDRIQLIDKNGLNFKNLYLAKYNLKISHENDDEEMQVFRKQYERLSNKFNFNNYDRTITNQKGKLQEVPMCVIIPSYNNNNNFRIQYNLNSVFSQNYTNYQIVIINDASNDGSDTLYKRYFQFYENIPKERYTYVFNEKRLTALENIYKGSMKYCKKDAIVSILDGDDQFLGREVFKTLAVVYQQKKAGFVYSNFIRFGQKERKIQRSYHRAYTEEELRDNNFHTAKRRFSHLVTYKNQLTFKLKQSDLQNKEGQFYKITYDLALFLPLLELSCGRVAWIQDQFQYLYNVGTGLNDYAVQGKQQNTVALEILKRQPQKCWKQFDEKMKNK